MGWNDPERQLNQALREHEIDGAKGFGLLAGLAIGFLIVALTLSGLWLAIPVLVVAYFGFWFFGFVSGRGQQQEDQEYG